MLISANYIRSVKGLASLEPPEAGRLGQTAKVVKGIGLERLGKQGRTQRTRRCTFRDCGIIS